MQDDVLGEVYSLAFESSFRLQSFLRGSVPLLQAAPALTRLGGTALVVGPEAEGRARGPVRVRFSLVLLPLLLLAILNRRRRLPGPYRADARR
jgi:hypothetical protein